jgi:predicted dehydrogenase
MHAPISVGLIGSQFISAIHAESLQHCPQAVLAAVASPTAGNAQALAERFGIRCALTDYRELLARPGRPIFGSREREGCDSASP